MATQEGRKKGIQDSRDVTVHGPTCVQSVCFLTHHTLHYTFKPNRCTLATRAGSELAEVYTLLELGEVDTPPLELA